MTENDTVPVSVAPRSGLEAPTVEDRYQSLFVIGKGGMGTVEVALERVEEGYRRIVALKRLHPEGARDPRHVQMFLREAKLAALLTHPNVVHAFAFGEVRGELYLAMEYVPGEPLSRILEVARKKEGTILPSLVAYILAKVSEGLHAAHELRGEDGQPLNVVHRDISPQNVMVSYEGQVKLLDFGVAKFDAAGAYTRTGEIKGKMAYMSPEQAMGDPLDRRSDLYSLGAVLFECIAGEPMWGSGTDLEIMRRIALEEPRLLADAAPSAPEPLAKLQARLVARQPGDRPPTARAVAEELRHFILQSGSKPGSQTVQSLMTRLFKVEAARQTEALEQALENAAPLGADELRKSLEPPMPVEASTHPPPTSWRPTAVSERPRPQPLSSSVDSAIMSSPEPRRGRSAKPLLAVLAVTAAGGIALGAVVAARARHLADRNAASPPAVTAAAIPEAPTSPSPSPSPSPSLSPSPTTTAPAKPPLQPSSKSRPLPSVAAKPPPSTARPRPGPQAPSDVDTDPLH